MQTFFDATKINRTVRFHRSRCAGRKVLFGPLPDWTPMTAVYAYLRISTDQQDTANQKRGVSDYCAARQWPVAYVEDTASGKKPWREREVGRLLDRMQRGDVLVVAEISRLGRSTLQVLELMAYASERGLSIHVVKGSMVLDGSGQSKMFAILHALFAEIERDFIVARTREALQRRKAEGLPMGRPVGQAKDLKLDSQAAEIDRLMGGKVPKRVIARVVGCSPQTLHTWLSIRRSATQSKCHE
jgi:DNA invertase Pin-like site-specific DNA recombinase